MATATATFDTKNETQIDTLSFVEPGFESRIFGKEPTIEHASNLATCFEPEFALARQRVLSYLVKLHRAISQDLRDLSETLLQRFCRSLTDYLSAGHQRTWAAEKPAPHQYVAMASTSREVMRFIDLFARLGPNPDGDLHVLLKHLDQLALTLITRIELEDELGLGIRQSP